MCSLGVQALEMARAGCDIIDFAIASMADLTSQPSLNAFCAAMAGDERGATRRAAA
jgi:pyruvate carboxylase